MILRKLFPGHMKWVFAYSIGRLKPDFVAQFCHGQEKAKPYLDRDHRQADLQGITLYLRRDSGECSVG